MLLLVLAAPAQALDVLVYGPNDYTEASILTSAGHTVTEATESEWAAMTQSDFESYDVIVMGDKSCSGPDSSDWDTIDSTRTTWSPAVTGNVLVTGTDAACHYSNTYASLFVQYAVEWAGSTSGTGLYVTSDWGRRDYDFLDEFGTWGSTSDNADDYTITDTSHALWTMGSTTITDAGMDSWGNTYHCYIDSYPSSDFDVIGTDGDGNTMTVVREADTDGDGYASSAYGGDDCDDTDASVNPGATELCDSVDNDCDGDTDEDDASDASTWYADDDGDGYGDADDTDVSCTADSGYVSDDTDCDDDDADTWPGAAPNDSATDCMTDADGDDYGDASATGDVVAGTDCDDDDASVNPGETEVVADGIDNDCDDEELCYVDDDGDGYGDGSGDTVVSTDLDCTDAGEADDTDDCDDDDASVYDGATELCDGLDNSCDGSVASRENDDDGDGYVECSIDASGWDGDSSVVGGDDCDDTDASAWPGADEVCDGVDNDCEGDVDEDDAIDAGTWYADSDSDGFGDASVNDVGCEAPSGYVSDDTDCDDDDAGSYPGAPETPYDGVDQDCDGSDWCDVDADGYLADLCPDGDDCDDDDADIHPDAEDEWYDGIDANCDEADDYDADGDGYASASYDGEDCDDADPDTYPGAPDDPYDGIINDCDGADEFDQDGDGYEGGDDGTDCDDNNSEVNPGAEDIPGDGVDQDCDGQDAEVVDTGLDSAEPVSDTGIPGDDKGCNCASVSPHAGIGLAALLGLALLRRRRR